MVPGIEGLNQEGPCHESTVATLQNYDLRGRGVRTQMFEVLK